MRVSNESLLIGAAVFVIAFGVLVTTLEHIRHPPAQPVLNVTGITGVYLGFYAEMEHVPWMYVPCLILILGAMAAQFRSSRPSGTNDDGRPAGGIR